jgi:amino acid transporter
VNRELSELLGELRVALPGVQVLFGFLLAAAFQPRFALLSAPLRVVFIVTLLSSAVSVVLLVAPAAQHRLRFRARDKEPMLLRFNRLAIAGLLCLGVALAGAVLLVTTDLDGPVVGVSATGGLLALVVTLWLVEPLQRRRGERSGPGRLPVHVRGRPGHPGGTSDPGRRGPPPRLSRS